VSLLCPSELVVAGAGLSAINGIYYQAGTRQYIDEEAPPATWLTRIVYSKDGLIDSVPRIDFESRQTGSFNWAIYGDVFYYQNVALYTSISYNYRFFPECPTNLAFTPTNLTTTAAPNVTVDAIVTRNDNHATATEDGFHRFRRLTSLGYV